MSESGQRMEEDDLSCNILASTGAHWWFSFVRIKVRGILIAES